MPETQVQNGHFGSNIVHKPLPSRLPPPPPSPPPPPPPPPKATRQNIVGPPPAPPPPLPPPPLHSQAGLNSNNLGAKYNNLSTNNLTSPPSTAICRNSLYYHSETNSNSSSIYNGCGSEPNRSHCGCAYIHSHTHAHPHPHSHQYNHQHPHSHVHQHSHSYAHPHSHPHGHSHIHPHGHTHSHAHAHPHIHPHPFGHPHPYHHHHHNFNHNMQMSASSSPSSLPPVESNGSSSIHRSCHLFPSNSSIPTSSDQIVRPAVTDCCNHTQRAGCCGHHHQASFCNNHHTTATPQDISHHCSDCSRNHDSPSNYSCDNDNLTEKTCASELNHHHSLEFAPTNRSSEVPQNSSMIQTAHTHNLSNSSTTTHSSNIAVKNSQQFHGAALSRGGRSSSSQQYEQYGFSSAASTSSATASLSNYPMPNGFEDPSHLFQVRTHHPSAHPSNHRSRIASPTQQLANSLSSNHNTNRGHGTNNTNGTSTSAALTNTAPIITTTFLPSNNQSHQTTFYNMLPPLPPKPITPSATSASTSSTNQSTPIRSSQALQNLPITRVTSQASVQDPLPASDVPPPLPPLNPGSRSQQILNHSINRTEKDLISNLSALSLNRNGSSNATHNNREYRSEHSSIRPNESNMNAEAHGICSKCNTKVMPNQEACKAMNQIYHASCFVCCECNQTLLGKTFYPVGERVYCEKDFRYAGQLQSLEKCAACSRPISNMILPAMGKSYHPECFKCCHCSRCLDGVPFTIDAKNNIYCVEDYNSIYSPKCAACGKSISPIEDTGETVRVVSMDKDYHVDCYCCEDCGLQLTDEEPSQSYPLDDHLLCKQCHIIRLNKKQTLLMN